MVKEKLWSICKVKNYMTTFRQEANVVNYQFLVIVVLLKLNGLASWLWLVHVRLVQQSASLCVVSYFGCVCVLFCYTCPINELVSILHEHRIVILCWRV